MKYVIAVLTVGACLLLPSAGVVFAADPHPSTTTGTGQPGTNNGISCGGTIGTGPLTGTVITGAPAGGTQGNVSPFNTFDPTRAPVYAGNSGNGGFDKGVGSPNSISQYDVACFQQSQKP
jgi:hypothetical protein